MPNPTAQTINEKDHKAKNKKFIFLVIVVCLILLIVSIIFSILTPIKEKIVANNFTFNNYNDTQTTFKKVFYSGEKIIIPEKFNIYQAQNNAGLAEELANRLINDYQLSVNEKIPNYWVGEKNALAKNEYEHNYLFTEAANQNGNSELKIIADEAINVCLNFYKKYSISAKLLPQKNDILYLNSNLEQILVAKKDATFLQIPLTYELDGYQVFYENKKDYPFFCRVDNMYTMQRAVFRDFFQEFSILKELPSISIDQAIKKIKNGEASIIDAKSKVTPSIDLNWIKEADLYSASIDYRFDEQLKIVYPFYKFNAKLTNTAGLNIEAIIITPAVETAKEK